MDKKIYWIFKKDWKITSNLKDLPDGRYTLRKVEKIRKLEQNRFYWGWFLKHIVLFYREIWEIKTTDELHNEYKEKFLRIKVFSDFDDSYIEKVGSTSEMNDKDFSSYIKKIDDYLKENFWFSVPPTPTSQEELEYWEKLFV